MVIERESERESERETYLDDDIVVTERGCGHSFFVRIFSMNYTRLSCLSVAINSIPYFAHPRASGIYHLN
jgi:hypothetical protein